MPTAVASAMAPSLPAMHSQRDISPKPSYANRAPSANGAPAAAASSSPAGGASPAERRASMAAVPSTTSAPSAPSASSPHLHSDGPSPHKSSPDGKRSPHQSRGGHPPKIIVKKEPISSPEGPATARHRPRRLDLSSSTAASASSNGARPSGSMTARDSTKGMQDVGLACLSPGFQTQDPTMREQLQRSISVRDQQRSIIESRLHKHAKGSAGSGSMGTGPNLDSADRPDSSSRGFGSAHGFGSGGLKTPMTSKKRPPPGLSIVPPSAEQFANERVIQSAPLHQTFTGRPPLHPLTRHTANGPSGLGGASHFHHVPALQTSNRLPPIADVLQPEGLGINRSADAGRGAAENSMTRPGLFHSASSHSGVPHAHRPLPSPGLPPPAPHSGPSQMGRDGINSAGFPPASSSSAPSAHRTGPREYRSAEEAVAEMTSGREDLLPKLVHYGGHQPPTPPSPPQNHGGHMTPGKPHGSFASHVGAAGNTHYSSAASQHAPPGHHGSQTNSHSHSHMHAAHSGSAAGDLHRPTLPGAGATASFARRRGRAEYERDNGSPPLGSGPSPRPRFGPFGEGRDSPDTTRRKKDEFLSLCARAWDLFHT